ncbi:MutS protein homolog 4, partial [Geodia barretti]
MSSIETGSRRSVTDSLSRSHPPKSLSYVTPGAGCTAVIVALVEGRGLAKGEIGMASFDLKRPEVILSQFSDSQTYTQVMMKLQVMQPIEVLMPSTACEAGNMTVLFKMISNMIKTANMVTVHRKYFNEAKGLSYIKELCLLEYRTVELEVSTKYYCLATAAALIKYVEYIQDAVYAPGFLKVTFQGSENTAMIDISTAENLELLSNAHNPASAQSLYGVLNHTKTPSGGRNRCIFLLVKAMTLNVHLHEE